MKSHGSMNRVYRLIWSEVLNSWVAVAESGRGRGKGSSRKLIAAALSLSAAFAGATPVGGQVVAGAGSVTQSGTTTTIQQASQNLSLNWKSFNIAPQETVNFVQPSASAIAVNRIFDTSGTKILGQLNANGQVYLINPNGILFGQGAQVNVGGMVASTLDFNDTSLNGNTRTFSGSGSGNIVNLGTINAAGSGGTGGYVALLGNTVSNHGTITAQRGSVALGAGSASTLTFQNNSLVKMQVDQSVLNSLAENSGLIRADGGMVVLSAGAKDALLASVVNNTGVIEARTVENHEGTIILLGGMTAGTVNVGGTLDASAPNGENGGFIETSAAHVNIADNAKITTLASNGKTGTWLIDPTNFTIAAGSGALTTSGIGATTLSNNLGNTSVIIATAAAGAEAGDIFVNSAVTWAANKLTLSAHNNININANLNASGAASLALEYGQGAVAAGNSSNYILAPNVQVDLPAGPNFSTKLGLDGTVKNYTVITSLGAAADATGGAATLQGMAATANLATNYVLGSNIEACATGGCGIPANAWNAGAGFVPIGNSSTRFTGTFDGLGHIISNLTINRPATNFVGLFGYTDAGTDFSIRNVGLLGGSVRGASYVGWLVGLKGGVGTVSNSYATGSVTGGGTSNAVGGLVGYNYGGTLSNSYATGSVSGGTSVGGLVGYGGGEVSNSYYATGSVSGGTRVGGLVGEYVGSAISNSYVTGSVSGTSNVGGLVGLLNYGVVSNSYATGSVNGTGGQVGGLVGYSGSEVSNSYATGSVSGTSNVGGLVGYNDSNSRISNSYATGRVDGGGGNSRSAGGLVGYNDGTVSNSYAKGGDVFGASEVGGLVGTSYGEVTYSYATGNVRGGSTVGGLVGYSDNDGGTISNSYATGSVSGAYSVGGLVGDNSGGSIINSYATGSVSGTSNIGGLVGGGYGTIDNSYATGSVSGTSNIGGLVGNNDGTVSNSYWDTQTSGQPAGMGAGSATGATGRTTAEMMSMASFTGFNIANAGGSGAVWRIYEGQTTPWLMWWLKPLTVAANGDSKSYSGVPYSGGNGVTYSVSSPNPALSGALGYSGTAQSAVNAGSYTIGASGLYSVQQGYDISYVDSTLTINKASLTVTADNKSRLYGAANPALSTTVSGFVNGETAGTAAGFAGAGSATTTAGATTNVGAAVITGSTGNLAATNYAFAAANGALTIGKANAIVTGNSGNATYSGVSQSVSGFSATGLVNGETASVLTGVSASGSGTNAGSYNVVASGTDSNYNLTLNNGALTISKANLTVTADNKSRLYGQANPALSTTVSGFVNGETAGIAAGFTGAGSAATTAGLTTNVGTAVITAGTGNLAATNYAFNNLVDGTLTINPAAPTINPTAPPVNSAALPEPVLNAMAQLQSEALFYRMNNEPQTLNLSPTLTVTQSADTERAASSSESVNPAAGSTRMNVNTLMNVNTIVMGPSLQIMNIGATGTTLQIVNGGMRLPDTLANEN